MQHRLANDALAWDLSIEGGVLRSTQVENRLTGRTWTFREAVECRITLDASPRRVHVPWWSFRLGDPGPRESERDRATAREFHGRDFVEDSSWQPVAHLMQGSPDRFDGSGWFRAWVGLPAGLEELPLTIVLGGFTQEDWNAYAVFLNGHPVGSWTGAGRWRSPGRVRVEPGSAAQRSLERGPGSRNLLAVHTRGIDRRFGGLADAQFERFAFTYHRLVDQYVAFGEPELVLSSFRVRGDPEAAADGLDVRLESDDAPVEVTLHYRLQGPVLRKWLEIENVGRAGITVLDVELWDLGLEASPSEGDLGFPVLVDAEAFAAIEHPAGLSQGLDRRIRLRHFPGRVLAPGARLLSKDALWGVARAGGIERAFRAHVAAYRPHRRLRSAYYPFGINGFQDDPYWTLDDEGMLGVLELLAGLRERGVRFDHFVPDVGWQDRTGDLARFLPDGFPDGPRRVVERAKAAGMHWGLWLSANWGDWSCGMNPAMAPSRTEVPGGSWPEPEYRDGFLVDDGRRLFCLASEPYRGTLGAALLHHVHESGLALVKFDNVAPWCSATGHDHLPCRHSIEPAFDALFAIIERARAAYPDLLVLGYGAGGIRSPFFLRHGDYVYDKRITMEAASTGDRPTLFFRDGVTLALDQATRFSSLLPPTHTDSLGVWLSDSRWANAMRAERWREAVVMDLGRGSLLFPQLWGDLRLLDADDVAFLARLQAFALARESLLAAERRDLGDPWTDGPYGYVYGDSGRCLLFLSNAHFNARPVDLRLDESLGLGTGTAAWRLRSRFPEDGPLEVAGRTQLRPGDGIRAWLRPFEVALWELESAAQGAATAAPVRVLRPDGADVDGTRLDLHPCVPRPDLVARFAEPQPHFRATVREPTLGELESQGYERRAAGFRSVLPAAETLGTVLAVVARFHRGGRPWRHHQPSSLVQALGRAGPQVVRFEPVPGHRQADNGQSAPWIVFRSRLARGWSGRPLEVGLAAILPPDVQIDLEAWVVPRWWAPG